MMRNDKELQLSFPTLLLSLPNVSTSQQCSLDCTALILIIFSKAGNYWNPEAEIAVNDVDASEIRVNKR